MPHGFRSLLCLAALVGLAGPAGAQDGAAPVTVALDWTPNTNHVGLYVAQERGYYEQAGIEVEILPYSDTSSGTLISNGVADFGVVSAIGFFTQRTAGADIKAVYAVVQHETGRLVFNADRSDIQRPADLDGLTYGGFGSAWEDALISTIIRNDGGKGEFETVTLGTSAYEALANGAVDFTLEVSTWEGVKAELDGPRQRAFVYSDYGVPDQHTTFIGASTGYLEANPETARAFVAATQRGYAYAAQNPDRAADILIDANPAALTDREFVHASMQALVEGDFLLTDDGVAGRIDPDKVAGMGTFLYESGILRNGEGEIVETRPDFSNYFTNAYLADSDG